MIVRFLGCEAMLRLLMADAMAARSLRYGRQMQAVQSDGTGEPEAEGVTAADSPPLYRARAGRGQMESPEAIHLPRESALNSRCRADSRIQTGSGNDPV